MILLVVVLAVLVGCYALGHVAGATRDPTTSLIVGAAGFVLPGIVWLIFWFADQASSGDGDVGLYLVRLTLLLTYPISAGLCLLGQRLGRRS